MPTPGDELVGRLDRYRPYLRLLARLQVDRWVQGKLDASDLVQQTLLEALRLRGLFEYRGEAELAGWLRQILAHQIAHAVRDLFRDKRDVRRQQSLEQALAASSIRLEHLLADSAPTPDERLEQSERALRLAAALEQLPEAQREAILAHYWHGRTLAAVAEAMNRTPASVAGLLQRGLKALRRGLKPEE